MSKINAQFQLFENIHSPKMLKNKDLEGHRDNFVKWYSTGFGLRIFSVEFWTVSTLPHVQDIYHKVFHQQFVDDWIVLVQFSLVNWTTGQMNDMEQTRSNPAVSPQNSPREIRYDFVRETPRDVE